jgi:hypothetical protein
MRLLFHDSNEYTERHDGPYLRLHAVLGSTQGNLDLEDVFDPRENGMRMEPEISSR